MSIGAITLPPVRNSSGKDFHFHEISFAGDTSYPTGGSAFLEPFRTAKDATPTIIALVPIECGGYLPQYDASTGKLKVYRGDNDGGADGPLVEVANATNLSGVTFKVLVISR
jgi:hypothetical protein